MTSKLPINLDNLLHHRLGEFLKELKLSEGRCTGIPIIRKILETINSPLAKITADEARTHFAIEFPINRNFTRIQMNVTTIIASNYGEDGAHDGGHDQEKFVPFFNVTAQEKSILKVVRSKAATRGEIAQILGLGLRSGFLLRAMSKLLELKLIEFTIPDKPRSKNQQLKTTSLGLKYLKMKTPSKRKST